MLAGGVDPVTIESLAGSVADLESPRYDAIHKQLEMMRHGNPLCRFLYLLGWKDGLLIFLSDSEPASSKDFSSPGSVYDDAPTAVRKIFEYKYLSQQLPGFTKRKVLSVIENSRGASSAFRSIFETRSRRSSTSRAKSCSRSPT